MHAIRPDFDALNGPDAPRLRDPITIAERAGQVAAQTRGRLAGVIPESATRVVSMHDPDGRLIRNSRLGRPVEVGYEAQQGDNADAVILDHLLELSGANNGVGRSSG